MQNMLTKNLSKVIIHQNKPRPAARGSSQNTTTEVRKEFYCIFVKNC